MTADARAPRVGPAARLFLLGFLTLFLELALIRYLAGNVWNLGFFPNLVLMGVFVGMGVGFVFHHVVPEERSSPLFHASAGVLLALVGFVYVAHPRVPGFDQWQGNVGGELYFTATGEGATQASYLLFLVLFAFVVCLFALISQRTAKCFREFAPLRAYTLDILGSCAGIVSFIVVSWLQVPAFLWFAFLLLLYGLIGEKGMTAALVAVALTVTVARLSDAQFTPDPGFKGDFDVTWSPYQKVESAALPSPERRTIYVNGISHQEMLPLDVLGKSSYVSPYEYRERAGLPRAREVLVIGAGSGNDVAVALLQGASHVDAVEIDPVIARIGRAWHPLRPYDDPRVTLTIDDGRAFMTHTARKYDVVIFALTDSLVKVSPVAQLRLENYLFTRESARRAFALLAEGGSVFFYNAYRAPWVKAKIQGMIHEATGIWPAAIVEERDFAMLTVDPAHPGRRPAELDAGVDVPTDDWPFLYLKQRGLPAFYLRAMVALAAFVALLAGLVHLSLQSRGAGGPAPVKAAFALMGTAFLLLETKSVIQFSLLFGTTWLNNSLVFLAVLLNVLAANRLAEVVRGRAWLWVSYVLLMAFCLSSLLYPLANLLAVANPGLRFAAASILTFSPIFFANLIFSVTFRDRDRAEHLFGWNLIGAAAGGILEYTSMALGYNALAVVVAACYAGVFALLAAERRPHLEMP